MFWGKWIVWWVGFGVGFVVVCYFVFKFLVDYYDCLIGGIGVV